MNILDLLPKGRSEQSLRSLAAKMRVSGLTYLSERKLDVIIRECLAARVRKSTGDFIEAGCALGGSTVVIAQGRPVSSKFEVFDTFEGMPPPSEKDTPDVHDRFNVISSGQSVGIAGTTYYGYRSDLYEHVTKTLETHVAKRLRSGIKLHKGLLQDTMLSQGPVAFAHVDVDWYEPVMVCAQRIFPRLEIEGVIIFDDYHDYGSCKAAVDEFFRPHKKSVQLDSAAGSMLVRRIG